MPDISEDSTYHAAIRQIETSDAIMGGAPGTPPNITSPINYSLKQLTDRTRWLFDNALTPIAVPNANESTHGIIRRATRSESLDDSPSDMLAVSPVNAKAMIDEYAPEIDYATESDAGLIRLATNEQALEGDSTTLALTALKSKNLVENTSGISFGTWTTSVDGTNWSMSGDYSYQGIDPFYIKLGSFVTVFMLIEFPSQTDKTTHFYNSTPSIKSDSSVMGVCDGQALWFDSPTTNTRTAGARAIAADFSRSTFSDNTSIRVIPSRIIPPGLSDSNNDGDSDFTGSWVGLLTIFYMTG